MKTIMIFGTVILLGACNSIIVGVPTVKIGGDFDGTSFVGGGGSAEIMPDNKNSRGTKFGLGNITPGGSYEFTIVESEHDGTWEGFATESEFKSINFDWKLNFGSSDKLKGVGIFGVGLTTLTIKDGSVGSGRVQDAKFKGSDFRFGVGGKYQFIEELALELNIIQRYGSFNKVDGVVSGSLEDGIDGDGTTTSLEMTYQFN